MESKENQNIDKLIKKLVQSEPLNAPSSEFKINLLQKLENRSKLKEVESQPLIPIRTIFLSIAVSIGAIAIYFLKGNHDSSNWWGIEESLSQYEMPSLNLFPDIQSTHIIIYAFVILAIMFYIQVFYLSSRYNNQLN